MIFPRGVLPIAGRGPQGRQGRKQNALSTGSIPRLTRGGSRRLGDPAEDGGDYEPRAGSTEAMKPTAVGRPLKRGTSETARRFTPAKSRVGFSGPGSWRGYCYAPSTGRQVFKVCQTRPFGRHNMKHQRHLGSLNAVREATQVTNLIADLSRIVDLLNADIAAREQEAGVTDPARPEYPGLARELRARRDNLLETIDALRQQDSKARY